MKKHGKIICSLCISLVILASAFLIANYFLSQSDYAHLQIEGKYNNYIFMNDSEKYCYMPYYNYKSTPDLKIREGKNYFLSLLHKRYGLYSGDVERNFIYCETSGFGVQIVGLYIKESALTSLFEPTAENIYRVVIYDENNEEVLSFNAENENLFAYFKETYSEELRDYSFPVDTEDEKVFNEEYAIHVDYLSGNVSRFFKTVNKEELQRMQFIADI